MLVEHEPYRNRKIRFLQMVLIAMTTFGDEYSFNNPQSLQQSFENDLHISQAQFDLLYSIFAFPNIFTSFLIGYLIDYFGVRIGLVTLSIGVGLSQAIISIGGFTNSYYTILIGRMFFGISSGSLFTAQASMMSFWFHGKELAFAIGIAITFPELGNALNSYLTPIIYDATKSLGPPLTVSLIICFIGIICAILAAYLDKKADQVPLLNTKEDKAYNISIKQTNSLEQIKEQIEWKDIKYLKWQFWLVCLIGIVGISQFEPFMDNANRLYQQRFCFTQISAGQAIMITYIIIVCTSPILGYIVDYVGMKRYFIIGTMSLYTLAQILVLVYPQCNSSQLQGSISGLILVGIGYCFYANCVVPVVPLVVKKKVTGTAFGITQSIEAIALTIIPYLEGFIVESAVSPPLGYIHSSIFFVTMGLVGILFSIGLLFVNEKTKKRLDKGQMNDLNNEQQTQQQSSSSYMSNFTEESSRKHSQQIKSQVDNGMNQYLLKDNQKYILNL